MADLPVATIPILTPTATKRKDPDTSPSPLSTQNNELKKSRIDDAISVVDIIPVNMALPNPDPNPNPNPQTERSLDQLFTKLEQIETQIALGVTKTDLIDETSKLVTKTQFEGLTKRISELEIKCRDNVQKMNKIEHDNQTIRKEMSEWEKLKPSSNRFVSPARLNLVIEGLPKQGDPYKLVIELGKCLDMQLDKRDFSLVVCMKGKKDSNSALIMACFVNMHTHDEMFTKRIKLKQVDKVKKVWINLDEPEEIRKQRLRMRKLAFEARSKGLEAFYTHSFLRVDGKDYKLSELDRVVLPEVPIIAKQVPGQISQMQSKQSTPQANVPSQQVTEPQPQRPPRLKHKNSPQRDPIPLAAFANAPVGKVKIAKTKAGYIFAGSTAYMSNFFKVDFVFEGVQYQLVEQGLQFKFAMFHKEFDIAQKVLGKTDGYDIKDLVAKIVTLDEWNQICEPLLKGMVWAKFVQNPALMDELVATYPHPLIEATRDTKWGGVSLLEPRNMRWVLSKATTNLV